MAVINIGGNLKRGCKSCRGNTENKKAGKIYFVQILRIKKQVRNAQVFTERAGDHRKENHPAKHHHMVALEVVKQQLNRERVNNRRKKLIKPGYHSVCFQVSQFFNAKNKCPRPTEFVREV